MTASRRCLIDSNVLIYMYDDAAADRQQVALQVFEQLVRQRRATLSTQCLTEFFNGVTRRIQNPVPVSDAVTLLNDIATATDVYSLTLDIVRAAVSAAAAHQMSLWDALIWSVASQNGITTILTEDSQSRPVIGGVRYVNPFAIDVDLESM